MSTTPLPEATPAPPAPPPAPGTLRELFLFLLAAVALFPLVQFAAINFLVYLERMDQPDAAWSKLIQQVVERHQFNAFFAVPLQLAYYFLLIGLLYILVTVFHRLPFGQSLRLLPLPTSQLGQGLAAGALLALLVTLLNGIFPPVETPAFERLFSTQAAALLVIAASLLMAPLVEEIIFRGYIYTVLERTWGVAPAVLLSGVLFGSIHFPQLWPGYFQMFLLCVVGVVFSLARARTGTTLASMALHFGYNAIISLLFLFSENFRDLPGPF
jgi:membrane protease YdiL (CAAX protease family)